MGDPREAGKGSLGRDQQLRIGCQMDTEALRSSGSEIESEV